MGDEPTVETALHLAYATLVGMPHGEYRATHQMAMATVRDTLARLTLSDPETLQNQYEALFGPTAVASSTPSPLLAAPYPDEQQQPYSGPEPGQSGAQDHDR